MSASDALSGMQFKYHQGENRAYTKNWTHELHAVTAEGATVGTLHWGKTTGHVRSIDVEPEHRRQGVATQLWSQAHELASQTRGVRPPRHSTERTNDGDAWARTVSRRLPRRYDA